MRTGDVRLLKPCTNYTIVDIGTIMVTVMDDTGKKSQVSKEWLVVNTEHKQNAASVKVYLYTDGFNYTPSLSSTPPTEAMWAVAIGTLTPGQGV